MPFETQGEEPLDAILNVRLTSGEKAKLKEDAAFAALSMSELVRRRYFGRPIVTDTDAVLLRELARIGDVLRRLQGGGGDVRVAEAAEALRSLQHCFRKINDDR